MAAATKDDIHHEEDVELSDGGEEGVEYEEVEEEVEEEEVDEDPEPVVETPTKNKGTPNKVRPTSAVKNMKHMSPETVAKSSPSTLTPGKNPFDTFGKWTDKTLSEIEIRFPVLSKDNETTNPKTRENKPEARYWKDLIKFSYGHFQSETLRFDNVLIPYHDNPSYGTGFIYVCFPGSTAAPFAEAGKTKRPTRAMENSLEPDPNRWWKIANNVSESFGVLNKATGKFKYTPLSTIFDGTHSGVRASIVVKFLCKASTDNKELIKPTTPCTIAIDIVRGWIESTDVDVQMPMRIKKKKAVIEPVATSRDVATDTLMKRLQDLGL